MFYFIKNIFKRDTYKNYYDNSMPSINQNKLVAPVTGEVVPLSDVPDQVFANRLIGDGAAILAESDIIVAPADGEITLIFKTKHAFAMTLNNGIEILVHIVFETVTLNDEVFEQLAKQGAIVKAGTPIIKINRNLILKKELSLVTLVLITNTNITKKFHLWKIFMLPLVNQQ